MITPSLRGILLTVAVGLSLMACTLDEAHCVDAFVDGDGDGFGDAGQPVLSCAEGEAVAAVAGDCDDHNAEVNPGAEERCAGAGGDEDCDGVVDEGVGEPFFVDGDGDGRGGGEGQLRCAPLAGEAGVGGDCDDGDASIYPGAAEVCGAGVDEDCDGAVDETAPLWHPDGDGDLFGGDGPEIRSCEAPPGYVSATGDCNDERADVHPAAQERCGEAGVEPVDEDCDAKADEGVSLSWHPDGDGDGFGDAAQAVEACHPPQTYLEDGGDCDDSDGAVHPGAAETCDLRDEDCDGMADEGVTRPVWYADDDGDGYGDGERWVAACYAPDGHSDARGDCDDDDPQTHPAAIDAVGDCIDRDCGAHPTLEGDPCGAADGEQICVGGLSPRCLPTLQAALSSGPGETTVWVGPGTYSDHSLRFEANSIGLRSTHGAEMTVIDASRQGLHFLFLDGETDNSLVEGFTLTGGFGGSRAGALHIQEASPTLRDLIISGNSCTSEGGGVYIVGAEARPAFIDVDFVDNACLLGNLEGGAVTIKGGAHARFDGCRFDGNDALLGGAIAARGGDVTVSQSTFTGNHATQGGAIYVDGGAAIDVSHAVFEDNVVEGVVFFVGGAIYLRDASEQTAISRTVFVGNRANLGGAIALERSSPTISASVLVANHASSYGGGGVYFVDHASPTFSDSILAYNSGHNAYDAVPGDGDAPIFHHCAFYYEGVSGGYQNLGDLGSTNLVADPLFLNWDAARRPVDVHLSAQSPLIDAGHLGDADPDASPVDIGLYGGAGGGGRDLDGDGLPDWFWPGERLADAPVGHVGANYDCDDRQPAQEACP